jgi:PhnB protein
MPAIPEGFSSIPPYLAMSNANQAIGLYQKAFGATEVHKLMCPMGSGKVMHACL